MESVSTLNEMCDLKIKTWYSFLPFVSIKPTARVGHSIVQDPKTNNLFCIGGATFDGLAEDNYVLNLKTMSWNVLPKNGFIKRYEHSVIILKGEELRLFVFGGATESYNMNDIQVYNGQSWKNLEVKEGLKPEERTHRHCAVTGDSFIIFSGGKKGLEAVSDRNVYIFDAVLKKWSILDLPGTKPCPRQGHSMTMIDDKIYVFGGLSQETIYDDLYVIDMKIKTWTLLDPIGEKPSARAAHSTVAFNHDIYLFGGLGKNGALNDLYCFKPGCMQWICISTESDIPPRLNFSMSMIQVNLEVPKEVTNSNNEKKSTDSALRKSPRNQEVRNFIFIHGGMNEVGHFFEDGYIFPLQ